VYDGFEATSENFFLGANGFDLPIYTESGCYSIWALVLSLLEVLELEAYWRSGRNTTETLEYTRIIKVALLASNGS